MKIYLILFLMVAGFSYAEEIGAEDEAILKNLDFFSSMELLDGEVNLEDLENLDEEELDFAVKGNSK